MGARRLWILAWTVLSAAILAVTPSCGDASCEATLTCYCTTPATGDAAVAGECTSVETSACVYAACVNGVCTAKPVEASEPCEGGTCDGEGACVPPPSTECTAPEDCATGQCSDGVCCDAACDGVCEACNLPGSVGVCTAHAEGTDPDDECAGEATCSSAGACNYAEHLWSKKFGTAAGELLTDLAVDDEGNIVIVGVFETSVDFGGGPLGGAGGADIFVAKLDSGGNHIWSKSFGDGANQTAWAVAIDSGGNVVVGGQFEGTVSFGGVSLTNGVGGADIFLVKLSPLGSHVWSKAFAVGGTTSSEGVLYDLAVDAADNVVFTGYVDAAVSFGGPSLSAASQDAYLAKLNPLGTHIWSDLYPGVGAQSGLALTVLPDDDIVLAGRFNNSITLAYSPMAAVGLDIFLARFSTAGTHVWSTRFGAGSASVSSLASNRSGDLLLGGYFENSIDFGGAPLDGTGALDAFVALLDASGVHRWSKGVGSAADDHVERVCFDRHGHVLVAGRTKGSVNLGGGPLLSTDAEDVFLGKLDASGAHLWSRIYAGSLGQVTGGLAAGSMDSVVLGGSFSGIVSFGGADLQAAGLGDVFLAAFGP